MNDHVALTDQLDILAALSAYAYGLDERRWDAWDEVFTEDAVIDFRPMGGKLETPGEMRARLGRPDPTWLFAQHPVTNVVIRRSGDTASVYSDYTVETARLTDVPGEVARVSGGGKYEDTFVRTPAGWRISERLVFMKWKESRTVTDEVARRRM